MSGKESLGYAMLATTGAESAPSLPARRPPTVAGAAWSLAATASGIGCAYHGVKRNNGSVGWGVAWFFLGSMFFPIAPAIALAQGFGKPE